jgi:formylglycine-generating enzyme required for sulfatase activity
MHFRRIRTVSRALHRWRVGALLARALGMGAAPVLQAHPHARFSYQLDPVLRDGAVVGAGLTPLAGNRTLGHVSGVSPRGATHPMRRLFLYPLLATLVVSPLHAQDTGSAFTNSLGMKFALVPGTTVLFATEETRVSDYATMLKSSGYEWTFKPHFEQGGDHPVVGINLQDALAFCNWLTQTERTQGKIKANQGQSTRPTRLPGHTKATGAHQGHHGQGRHG